MTGRTTAGREGLADLIRLAKLRPKPFDCILIDDTSRLGRYLPDVLRECDRLMHYGVFLYFASDRLDSHEPSFRIMHIFKGFRDEDAIRDMGKSIGDKKGAFSRDMSQGTLVTATKMCRSQTRIAKAASENPR